MTQSQRRTLKYSTFLTASFYVFTASLLWSAPTANGGLLSSLIRQNRNFHYVVERVFDNQNEISSEEEEKVTIGEKGTATLQSSSSSSSLLRMQTSYSDCGSAASIKNLLVSPCANAGNSDICEIERGSNVTFNLSFVPSKNATQLKAVIHGIVDFVPIPLPCPEPDACQNSGLTCPIQAGTQYDYVLNAQVKESYPKMKLWVKGQLEDEDERNVICVKIHVHIV